MSWQSVFAARVRGLFAGDREERELEEELRFHLEMQAEDNRRAGMKPEEARYAAARSFGGLMRAKEQYREGRSFTTIVSALQDVRYALRGMRKNPGFAATAVASLALGIGANTAIFSLLDALMLRWLPVSHPAQLVQIVVPEPARIQRTFSYPMVRALASREDVFAGLAGFSMDRFNIGAPERVPGAWISGAYYETLGLAPIAGRLLAKDDDQSGATPVAVISDGYWARRFGRDPGAIGRSIRIENTPVTIVGVSPPGFSGMDVSQRADITMAIAVTPQIYGAYGRGLIGPGYWTREIVARLRPGTSLSQAKAALAATWPQSAEFIVRGLKPDLIPAGTGWTELREEFEKPLLALMGIAATVLLIACASLANLLLARSTARQREIVFRLAIGASRMRLVRQLLTESVLLAGCGAALAVAIGKYGSGALVEMLSRALPNPIDLDISPNGHILAFASAVSTATVMLFGLIPAFRATAGGPSPALKDNASQVSGGRRSWLGPALVVVQVGLSLLLLIGAGLFVRTLRNLRKLDAGFRHDGVLLVNMTAPGASGWRDFFRDAQDRAQRIPGVTSVGLSMMTPLQVGTVTYEVKVPELGTGGHVNFDRVGPGYFQTLRTPILKGREFTPTDDERSPRVAIVNQAFVRAYLEGGEALGRRVIVDEPRNPTLEIIGVVKDVRSRSLREPAIPALYVCLFQRNEASFATLSVHAGGSFTQVASALRREFSVEPHPLDDQVEKTLIQERLMARLATSFGALAVILASVGLYGLMAYTVSRRTNEIGIRMALGATRESVLWLVMRDALKLLVLGTAIGLPAAWGLSRLIATLLFGLTPTDPLTVAGATATLALWGLAAAFLPARRAARVDPMAALRIE
jgi:putative ABC transport system permease protein